jgi:hypothetical protein
MKLTRELLIAAVAASIAASVAVAQGDSNPSPPPGSGQAQEQGEGPGQGHRHHRPPPLPLVEALDANHDGVIDSNEIANAATALKTLDKNGDGKLTTDEYLPPRPKDAPAGGPPAGHQHPVSPVVQALDANHDGVIDASEIANAPAALKTLDKNGDGKLTRDEIHPPRPNGPPPGGPQGGPEGDGQRPPPPPDEN